MEIFWVILLKDHEHSQGKITRVKHLKSHSLTGIYITSVNLCANVRCLGATGIYFLQAPQAALQNKLSILKKKQTKGPHLDKTLDLPNYYKHIILQTNLLFKVNGQMPYQNYIHLKITGIFCLQSRTSPNSKSIS